MICFDPSVDWMMRARRDVSPLTAFAPSARLADKIISRTGVANKNSCHLSRIFGILSPPLPQVVYVKKMRRS
jgi:hypothetical protein